MAVNVSHWVWNHSSATGGSRLVLLAIADNANASGMAYPSMAELVRKTRLSERGVQSGLASLAKSGELEIGRNGGPRRCNRYQVIMAQTPQNLHPAESAPPQNLRQTPQNLHPDPAESAPGTTIEPSGNRKSGAVAPTAQTILAAFIDWDRAQGGQLTQRVTGQLAKAIDVLLKEGIDDRHIRKGLSAWRAKEQHPSTLDSFVNAAMNGKQEHRHQSTGDRAIAEASALKAQLRTGTRNLA